MTADILAEIALIRASLDRLEAEFDALVKAIAGESDAPAEPVRDIVYDTTLQLAAGRAEITPNALKVYLRKYGLRLGRKRLGRWEVSSAALDRLLETGSPD